MSSLAFIQNIGLPELAIIFLFILVFFGAKRLPELFGSFGKSIKEFKKATREIENDITSSVSEAPQASAPRETVSTPAPEAAPQPSQASNETPKQ